jgi:FlaA1/EpsC-like NDP-sugar epimerase
MEKDCYNGYETNITGTNNVVQAAIANSVKRFCFVSTDKAVAPINAYGVSKAAAEHIVKQAARDYPKIRFRILRSGNILGSSSSVLQIWKDSLQKENKIKVTVPEMTRFYIRVEGAVKRLLEVTRGSVWEPDNDNIIQICIDKYATVETLAKVAVILWGNNRTRVEFIGDRGGEKLHEQILSVYDGFPEDVYSCDTQEYAVDELVEIISEEV